MGMPSSESQLKLQVHKTRNVFRLATGVVFQMTQHYDHSILNFNILGLYVYIYIYIWTIPRPQFHLSLLGSFASLRTYSTWRRKWECLKAGESNGKLPPRTCPGFSVPEPCRSHDWALVPANPASKVEY